jgi:RNA polymerase sigma-70 factor (ECF subfamily)
VNVLLARRSTLALRRARHEEGDVVFEGLASRAGTPELAMDFEAAVERLAPGMREVFVLHDVEGYKHEEIARLLGISAGTSKSQLHRVRMALRRHLDR